MWPGPCRGPGHIQAFEPPNA